MIVGLLATATSHTSITYYGQGVDACGSRMCRKVDTIIRIFYRSKSTAMFVEWRLLKGPIDFDFVAEATG